MSLTDFKKDDSEEQSQNDGKKRVSYLYIREPGHKDNPNQYNEQAYQYIKSGGLIRNMMKNSEYGDVHGFASHIIVAVADILEEGDFGKMWQILEPKADHLHEYLQDNPEIRAELIQKLKEDQNAGNATSSDEESDTSDD